MPKEALENLIFKYHDKLDIRNIDFTGSIEVKINPQKIKNIIYSKLIDNHNK